MTTDPTAVQESTKLSNSTFDIIRALEKEADFLYSTIDTYVRDAEKENRRDLVSM